MTKILQKSWHFIFQLQLISSSFCFANVTKKVGENFVINSLKTWSGTRWTMTVVISTSIIVTQKMIVVREKALFGELSGFILRSNVLFSSDSRKICKFAWVHSNIIRTSSAAMTKLSSCCTAFMTLSKSFLIGINTLTCRHSNSALILSRCLSFCAFVNNILIGQKEQMADGSYADLRNTWVAHSGHIEQLLHVKQQMICSGLVDVHLHAGPPTLSPHAEE